MTLLTFLGLSVSIDWRAFAVAIPVLLVSLTLHEMAHGYVAAALGDGTAREHGRLSPNPLRHLDPLGSLVLFGTLIVSGGSFAFGWAKPVPVDPRRLRDPQHGMMLVGAAGPLTNMALAVLAGFAVRILTPVSALGAEVAFYVFELNVILALINLLPVPPLDGSRIVGGLLPANLYPRWMGLDRYASFIFMGLLVVVYAAPRALSWYYEPALRFLTHTFLPPSYWVFG